MDEGIPVASFPYKLRLRSRPMTTVIPTVVPAVIPISDFGTRWLALKDPDIHLEDHMIIPLPPDDLVQERGGVADVFRLLAGAVSAVFLALFLRLISQINRSVIFHDIISDADNLSLVCYLATLIVYAIYLGVYYRVIWSAYYGLHGSLYVIRADRRTSGRGPNDNHYFVHYALFLTIFSVGAMLLYPLAWPIYIAISFGALTWKKWRTMNLFCAATDEYLLNKGYSDIDGLVTSAGSLPMWVRQIISARQLSISFTRNFVVWGGAFFLCSVMVVFFGGTKPINGWILGTHQMLSLALLVLMVVFFIMKTTGGGIRSIHSQIESGEWRGFTLVRPPWR